jgi:hypothetical protein
MSAKSEAPAPLPGATDPLPMRVAQVLRLRARLSSLEAEERMLRGQLKSTLQGDAHLGSVLGTLDALARKEAAPPEVQQQQKQHNEQQRRKEKEEKNRQKQQKQPAAAAASGSSASSSFGEFGGPIPKKRKPDDA